MDGNRDQAGSARWAEEAGGTDSSQKCHTDRNVHRKIWWEIHTWWENNIATSDGVPAGCPTFAHLTPALAKLEEQTTIASDQNNIKGRKDKGTRSLQDGEERC